MRQDVIQVRITPAMNRRKQFSFDIPLSVGARLGRSHKELWCRRRQRAHVSTRPSRSSRSVTTGWRFNNLALPLRPAEVRGQLHAGQHIRRVAGSTACRPGDMSCSLRQEKERKGKCCDAAPKSGWKCPNSCDGVSDRPNIGSRADWPTKQIRPAVSPGRKERRLDYRRPLETHGARGRGSAAG